MTDSAPQPLHQAYAFDARGISRRFRHAAIFGSLDTLQPGEAMRFINDHDPVPLLEQLNERFAGQLQADYLKREPGEIVINFSFGT